MTPEWTNEERWPCIAPSPALFGAGGSFYANRLSALSTTPKATTSTYHAAQPSNLTSNPQMASSVGKVVPGEPEKADVALLESLRARLMSLVWMLEQMKRELLANQTAPPAW